MLGHSGNLALGHSGGRQIVGRLILAVAVGNPGIQQFGGLVRVAPKFDGVTLPVAIGIAGHAQRKRGTRD